MAAEIIDERPIDAEELAPVTDLGKKETPPETTQPEDDIPDKYKGKSLKDIITMHQDAERLIGRQGSEVGELRKVVDDFIQSQTQPVKTERKPEDDIDFFTDPATAVQKAIDSHPSIVEARKNAELNKKEAARAQFLAKHPKAMEQIADPRFIEWVMASEYRQNLLVRADREYDVAAAGELFTAYEERLSLIQQTQKAEEGARKATTQRASTGNAAGGSTDGPGRKIYRRTDIIKLMRDDPERYAAIAEDVRKAYVEGRVR